MSAENPRHNPAPDRAAPDRAAPDGPTTSRPVTATRPVDDMGGADTEHGGPGLSDLMGELGREISTLFRQEVELAKAEVREQSKRAGAAAGKLVAAAVIGLVAALLLSWTLVYLIDLVAPEWVGFAIVGVVYAVVAAVLGANGRKQMQNVNPKPEQTAQTIQEDKGWLKNR